MSLSAISGRIYTLTRYAAASLYPVASAKRIYIGSRKAVASITMTATVIGPKIVMILIVELATKSFIINLVPKSAKVRIAQKLHVVEIAQKLHLVKLAEKIKELVKVG